MPSPRLSASNNQPRAGSTGPPIHTGKPLSPSGTGGSSWTMAEASVSVHRLITSPIAPSSRCSHSSTTDLEKFGSCSCGMATSNDGANELV